MENYYILSGSTAAQGVSVTYPSRVFIQTSHIIDFLGNTPSDKASTIYVLSVSVSKAYIVKNGSELSLIKKSGAVVTQSNSYLQLLRKTKIANILERNSHLKSTALCYPNLKRLVQ